MDCALAEPNASGDATTGLYGEAGSGGCGAAHAAATTVTTAGDAGATAGRKISAADIQARARGRGGAGWLPGLAAVPRATEQAVAASRTPQRPAACGAATARADPAPQRVQNLVERCLQARPRGRAGGVPHPGWTRGGCCSPLRHPPSPRAASLR